ncbi:transposase [Streptomyces sp. NPDC055094]
MNSGSRPPRCCRRSLAPQGGGTAPCDERAVFTAVVYALTSGCAWRHLPPTFSTSPATATAHRRFTVWTEAGPCGVGCTGRRWTNSGPGARSTGPRRSSTRPPFAPTGGVRVGAVGDRRHASGVAAAGKSPPGAAETEAARDLRTLWEAVVARTGVDSLSDLATSSPLNTPTCRGRCGRRG